MKRFSTASLLIFSAIFVTPVIAADYQAPLIKLPAASTDLIADDQSPSLSAVVKDNTSLSSVKLYYRSIDSEDAFTPLPMTPSNDQDNHYAAKLPIQIRDSAGIEYYVEAQDHDHNISQEPFPSRPRKLGFDPNKSIRLRNMSDNATQVGLVVNQALVSVSDPDGSAANGFDLSLSAFIDVALSKKLHLSLEASQRNFLLPYGESDIGQDVKQRYLQVLLQRPYFAFKRQFRMLGGIAASAIDFSDRANQVNNIITNKYPDRSQNSIALVVGGSMAVLQTASGEVGLRALLQKSLQQGVNSLDLSLYLGF